MATDFELLELWAAGDRDAGSELFGRHFLSVYRFFANKLASAAEDLAQQTFLACVEHPDRFRREVGFRSYVLGIARNVLHNEYRRRRRKDDKIDFGHDSMADLGPGASTLTAEREERRLVLEALRRLPVDYQVALELYLWEDLSGAQMAAVLGLGEPGVRSRLRRAKAALRAQIEALQDSPRALASTATDLDDWAASIRQLLLHQPAAED